MRHFKGTVQLRQGIKNLSFFLEEFSRKRKVMRAMIIMQRLWILRVICSRALISTKSPWEREQTSLSLVLTHCFMSLCHFYFVFYPLFSMLGTSVAASDSHFLPLGWQVVILSRCWQPCAQVAVPSCLTGLISFEEFHQTWKLFSSHMNIELTDDGINDLVRSIDFNKDGNIDFNEFLEAFRLVKQSQ